MTERPSASELRKAAHKSVCHRLYPSPPCDGSDRSLPCFKKHRAIEILADRLDQTEAERDEYHQHIQECQSALVEIGLQPGSDGSVKVGIAHAGDRIEEECKAREKAERERKEYEKRVASLKQ